MQGTISAPQNNNLFDSIGNAVSNFFTPTSNSISGTVANNFNPSYNPTPAASYGPGAIYGPPLSYANTNTTQPTTTTTTNNTNNTYRAPTTAAPTNNTPQAPQAPSSYTDPSTGQQFPSYDAFSNEVNNQYNSVLGAFDTTKQNLMNNQQTYLNAATSPFAALQPGIDTAYQQGQNLNANQVNQTQQGNQNALSSARDLFNQLMQGQQQKYGGTSGVGEFAKAFLGKGLQQQIGGLQSTLANNLGTLSTGLQDLTSQHTANTQQLAAEQANALSQAQKDFQDRLDSIDAQKNVAIQDKANMKLQELSNLRNTASQIAASFQQAQLNAGTAHQASLDALRNSIAGFQAYSGKPIDLSAYNQAANPLNPANNQPITVPNFNYQGSTGAAPKTFNPLTGQYQ